MMMFMPLLPVRDLKQKEVCGMDHGSIRGAVEQVMMLNSCFLVCVFFSFRF
jgi:hypothetical protein